MSQSQVFLSGEADAYYSRNKEAYAAYRIEDDIVAQCIEAAGLQPKSILDLGCASGERLEALVNRYGCTFAHGVDASSHAIAAAGDRGHAEIGWAMDDWTKLDDNTWGIGPYDLVITSYVFHWADRPTLIQTMANVHRLVKVGGHLVINDFCPNVPGAGDYRHAAGVMTYKEQYQEMFRCTGLYSIAHGKVYPYHGDGEPCSCVVMERLA